MLKKLEELQEDIRVMHFQNKEAKKENARRLDVYDETLRDIEEQMKHLQSASKAPRSHRE